MQELLRKCLPLTKAEKYEEALALLDSPEARALQKPVEVESLNISKSIIRAAYGGQLIESERWQEGYEQLIQAFEVDARYTDRQTQAAKDLTKMGYALYMLGSVNEAISYLELSESLAQKAKNPEVEALASQNLGLCHEALRDYDRAVTAYRHAWVIRRDVLKDEKAAAYSLGDLGSALGETGDYQEGFVAMEMALKQFEKLGMKLEQARLHDNLAALYIERREFSQAEHHLELGLRLANESGDTHRISVMASGLAYTRAMEKGGDLSALKHSLIRSAAIFLAEGRNIEGVTMMNNLMVVARREGNVKLATFYGKQAIGALQTMREKIRAMDSDVQRRFVKSMDDTYRILATILCEQDRLEELCQVIEMLQMEEYLNFERLPTGVPTVADILLTEQPTPTLREITWSVQADEIGKILRKRFLALAQAIPNSKSSRDAEESLEEGYRAFERMTLAMETDFLKPSDKSDQVVVSLSSTERLTNALSHLHSGTAFLYTLCNEDRLISVVVLPDRVISVVNSTSRDDVKHTVADFRGIVENSDDSRDIRPEARKVYELLFPKLERTIHEYGIRSLLVSLDGPLRSLPLAALSPDGQRFLIQDVEITHFTPGGTDRLVRPAPAKWSVLAAGMSVGQPPLPGSAHVVEELATNIFPGRYLLNSEPGHPFNLVNLRLGLESSPAIVHLDTHFVLGNGEMDSYLLLGDGSHWRLSDIKQERKDLFAGVDLMTLSACSTGDVRERPWSNSEPDLENIAILAQRKGATAVLATLWEAGDAASSSLMPEFYRDLKQGSLSKPGILRQLQLSSFLDPSDMSSPESAIPNLSMPYAHPKYWACWQLLGNAM